MTVAFSALNFQVNEYKTAKLKSSKL